LTLPESFLKPRPRSEPTALPPEVGADGLGSMQDDPFRERLKRLEERIEAARGPKAGEARQRSKTEISALGWRLVTELLAGMLLGLAIGYGLDRLFGTLPLFLVVFALLGFAAGVRTMLRSVEEVKGKKPVDATGDGGDGPADRP
jgi:ATP synthase protein I